MSDDQTMLQWALAYARLGWRVFPSWWIDPPGSCACPGGSGCGRNAGKHPILAGWTELATTDVPQITAWWTRWPKANISVATGASSGFFVLDVDIDAGGADAIAEYERMSEEGLPLTCKSVTGSGGWHLLYRAPEGLLIRNSVKKFLPGVDVRGEGGQIIVPPSMHVSGNRYDWADQSQLLSGPTMATPELIDMLTQAGSAGTEGSRRDTSDIPADAEMLKGVSEGGRNEALFRWGCKLRRTYSPHEVNSMVREAAARCTPPYAGEELEVLIRQIFRQDHSPNADPLVAGVGIAWAQSVSAPRDVEVSEDPLEVSPDDAPVPDLTPMAPWNPGEPIATTDMGNARRVKERYGDALRHTRGHGWWWWTGRVWTADDSAAARCAHAISGLVLCEAEASDDDANRQQDLVRWAKRSESAATIRAALDVAKNLEGISVGDDDFDRDPWLLNVRNGVIDLRSGRLRARRRNDHLTRIAPVEFTDGGVCPRWEKFMETILPDPSTRWFVQKALGYSLTGDVSGKCFFILYGAGDNGKSMMLETVYDVIFGGNKAQNLSYATRPHESIVVRQHQQEHATVLAQIRGARFGLSSDDLGRGDSLNEKLLKKITGGDTLTARFIGRDGFTFTPALKLWIATNERPGVSETGKAMRTRARFIPFTHTYGPDDKRDASIVRAEFREEAAGILQWMLRGLEGFREEGLDPSSEMADELEDFLDANDAVGAWIEEKCEVSAAAEGLSLTEIYHEYNEWAVSAGGPKISRRTLENDLKRRTGIERTPSGARQKARYGIRRRPVTQYGFPV